MLMVLHVAAHHNAFGLSFLHPGNMDHTCARAALLEAQSFVEHRLVESCHECQSDRHYHNRHHQQGHHYRSPTLEGFIDSASPNLHHQHPQHQQSHQYHTSEIPAYSHLVHEGIGVGPSSVTFNVPCQQDKEKPALVQPDLHLSTSPASNQVPYKHSEEASSSSKACPDGHFPPSYQENTLLSTEGRHSHHHSSALKEISILGQPQIKLLCSIGGRIMARPVDGRLRYCGGETRIITLNRGILYEELMTEMALLYRIPVILKYQLPGEDLDALVSVSSDDDLQNMLEEYDKLVSSNGNAWLRLFLFNGTSQSESIDCDVTIAAVECCADVMNQYVHAVNLVSEYLVDAHSEGRYDDVVVHQKKPVVLSNTRTFPVKPSAQSSVPSSPSGDSWQAHMKQGTVVDNTYIHFSTDQLNIVSPMNGPDITSHEANQNAFLNTSKFDSQSQVVVDSPRKQFDVSSSRGEAMWTMESGQYVSDMQGAVVHHCMSHLGTGTGRSLQMCGISGPQFEPPRMNQSKQVVQRSTAFTSQVQMEVNRQRPEAMQHCHLETRKQLPSIHTSSHQAISPLHNEGLAWGQRGQEFVGANPVYPMGSAPSSPWDAGLVKCTCNQQHVQVHRGINVSFGKPSHGRRPVYLPDQCFRKHSSLLVSRFSDNSSHFIDHSADWLRFPHPMELDEEGHASKQTCDFIRPVCHHTECWVNRTAHDCDPHSLKEPLHILHDCPIHRCCCGQWKVPHARKGLDFPMSRGFHEHMENHLGGIELDATLKPTFQGHKGELTDVRSCMGTGILHVHDGVSEVLTPLVPANCALLSESLQVLPGSLPLGQEGSDFDRKLASFSSTDAVAGSVSAPPDEPLVWFNPQPSAAHDNSSRDKNVYTMPPGSDLMASSHEAGNHKERCLGMHALGPYVSGSYKKGMPIDKHGGETCETRAQHMPFTQIPEHNSITSRASCSQALQYINNSAGFPVPPPPFPSVGVTTFDEPSTTLASPMYDRTPISSINATTFSFTQGKEYVPVNEIQDDKGPTLHTGGAADESVRGTTSSILDFQVTTNNQSVECGMCEADDSTSKLPMQESGPLEGARSQAPASQKQCSTEVATHVDGRVSMDVLTVQHAVVDEVDNEDDEKQEVVPANQAEAEAIDRGLQIIKNDDLEDLRELGSGTYGTVFHGKWRGSDVAIKRIKASCFTGHPSMQERLISDFWREAATLSQLHHPNVVAFYGVVPDGPGGTLATVTECMVNGSLKQVLVKKDRTIDRRKRLLIAMDTAFGMEYLHSRKIVHFDLKSENLLVNMRDAHRPICKVGDLGLSKVKHQTLVSGGVRGTLPWMAPELLSGKRLVTEKVDVYSFGIVMWELLMGEEPYANMRCTTIIGGIVNGTLRPATPSWCDPSWRQLMERCWSGDPAERPAFSEVASELRTMAQSMNIK